ncbi:MAG: hypothetical protein NC408_08260 [Candidatus Gastranaerophilales bacterium]|nr:hypothetical protein [Candidatus Gastranaerophilales bacterium]
MVAPISALMNMEAMLYGGMGPNAAAPSFVNGYRGGVDMYNSMAMNNPYMYNMAQNPYAQMPSQYSASSQITQPQQETQTTASKSDLDTLVDYYKKNSVLEEGLGGAAFGGLTFAAMENPQTLAHPINAFKATGAADKLFKTAMEASSEAKALWKSSPSIMQDAYSQLYRVTRNGESKWAISKWFIKPMEATEKEALQKIMTDAIKSGDKEAIQIATEQLRAASKCNGRLPQAWQSVKNFFTGNKTALKTPTELAEEALTSGAAKKAVTEHGMSFAKKCLSEGKGWFLFDMVFSAGKIWTAFTHKDGGVETGLAQTGQSVVKAAGNAFGWVAGKAAGGWAGAKLGAMIGSAYPGVGTAIGAVVGFIGGSLGMWAMGKVTKKLVGEDVATGLEAKDKKNTAQGQQELLSLVVQRAQAGEKVPDKVMKAAENVASGLQLQRA